VTEYFVNRSGDGHKAVLVSDVQDSLGGYTSAQRSDLLLYSDVLTNSFCVYVCVIDVFGHEISTYEHTAEEDVSHSVSLSPVS
jgi:hypothetical protein